MPDYTRSRFCYFACESFFLYILWFFPISSISQFTDSELTVAQDPRFDITEFTEDSCVEAQVPKENSNLDISGNLLDEFGSSDDDELLMATQRMEQQFSQESTGAKVHYNQKYNGSPLLRSPTGCKNLAVLAEWPFKRGGRINGVAI